MRKRGFSLIEIILVMVVLSIGLTTLILVLRYSVIQSANTHFYTIANWLCQERMEEIISERRDNGFSAVESLMPSVDGNPVPGFSGYRRTTTLSYTDLDEALDSSDDYILIEVEVTGGGSATPLSMETVVSNY